MNADDTLRVLTVTETARLLRCSKAHVHHLIAGTVPGVRPLPSLWLGRRRLILRASFEEWIISVETIPGALAGENPNKTEGNI